MPINAPPFAARHVTVMSRALAIAARIVAVLGICFISLFAFDVFEAGRPPAEIAVGLFMHLLPSFGLIAVLAVAWRWPGTRRWVAVACTSRTCCGAGC